MNRYAKKAGVQFANVSIWTIVVEGNALGISMHATGLVDSGPLLHYEVFPAEGSMAEQSLCCKETRVVLRIKYLDTKHTSKTWMLQTQNQRYVAFGS